MFGISVYSLVVSLVVFYAVDFGISFLNPANPFFARLLVILLGTIIVSVIFSVRQFKYLGKSKWKSSVFHKALMRTFIVNFIVLFALQMVQMVF